MKKSRLPFITSAWSRFRRQKAPLRAAAEGAVGTAASPRYEPLADGGLGDIYFTRLQDAFYRRVHQGFSSNWSDGRRVFWESGRIYPGRPYFYLKPHNELGWLCERSGLGWVISRSEKIVGEDLFLRQNEPWDIAVLYQPLGGGSYCRVAAQQSGGDLISFAVYERCVVAEIWGYDGREEGLRLLAEAGASPRLAP